MHPSDSSPSAVGTESLSVDELQAELARAEQRVHDLQTALDSRIVIEQAKGILRERFAWSIEEAFEVLRYAARSARMNLHALAADVVAREVTPNPIVVAIARGARWRAAQMRERVELQRFRADELENAIRGQQERLAWKQKERGEGLSSPEGQR